MIAPTLGSQANGESVDDQADGETNGQSRGPLRATRPRAKKGRPKDGEKLRGCKLSVPESVFERLRLTAIKRKTNMSVLAAEILDRNLPHVVVTLTDRPPAAE
jgi:hypothetical protein